MPELLCGLWDLVWAGGRADRRRLEGAVERCYGRTFYDIVVRQRIERVLGVPSDRVHVDVGTLFWLIPPADQLSRSLLIKKILRRVGRKVSPQGDTGAPKPFDAFYPSPKGFGGFCESLAQAVVAAGGELRTDASIQSLRYRDGRVTGAVMDDGRLEELDDLIWTGELSALLRLVGLDAEPPPPMIHLVLFNFEMTGSPVHDYLWVEYADPNPLVARACVTTLHRPANAPAGHYGISAEVPCREESNVWKDPEGAKEGVRDMLYRTGFVRDRASFGLCHTQRIPRVWPVLDVDYEIKLQHKLAELARVASNVHLTNQAGGGFQPIGRILRRALDVSNRIAAAPAPPPELVGSELS